MSPPRVVILNNEIVPYRIPLFERLAHVESLCTFVLYSTGVGVGRQWKFDRQTLGYPHKILPGFSLRTRKPLYHEWRIVWFNPSLFYELIRQRPDVIIGYEYSIPALTAVLYSKFSGCKYITWSEMTGYTERTLTGGQRLTRRVIRSASQAFIGTSNAACQQFIDEGMPAERVVLAPQTLDVSEYLEAPPNDDPAVPIVLFCGFLNERKGVIHLLKAFRLVLAEVPNARLRLVGEGELHQQFIQFVAQEGMVGQVDFLGFVEPAEMPSVYVGAQVFVLPSLEDTFGVVAVEALASGLSLICSPNAGVSSHLTDGENAFIVAPEDHERMAEQIVRLLQSSDLRAQFYQNSRPLLDSFTPDHVSQQFETAIRIALNAGKTA